MSDINMSTIEVRPSHKKTEAVSFKSTPLEMVVNEEVFAPTDIKAANELITVSAKGDEMADLSDIGKTYDAIRSLNQAVDAVNTITNHTVLSVDDYRNQRNRSHARVSQKGESQDLVAADWNTRVSQMEAQESVLARTSSEFLRKSSLTKSLLNAIYRHQAKEENAGKAPLKLNPKVDRVLRATAAGGLAVTGGYGIYNGIIAPAPSEAQDLIGESRGEDHSSEQTENLASLNLTGLAQSAIDVAVNLGIISQEIASSFDVDNVTQADVIRFNTITDVQGFSTQGPEIHASGGINDNQQGGDGEDGEPVEIAMAPINPTETPGPIHSVPSFRLNQDESDYLFEQSQLAMEANGQDPSTLDPNRYAYTIGLPTGDMSANLNLDQYSFGDGLLDDSIAAVWESSREIIAQNLEANPNLRAQLVVAIDNGEAVTAIKLVNGETTTLLIGNSNDGGQPLQLVVEEGQTELIIKTNSYLTEELNSRGYQISEGQFIFTAYETLADGTKAIVSIASTGNEYYTLEVPIVIAEAAPANPEQTNMGEIITFSSESLIVYSETGTDRIVASPFIESDQLEYRADTIKAYQYLMAVNTFGNGRFNGMNIDQMIQILENVSQGNMGDYSTEDFNVTLPQVINIDGTTSTNLTVNLLEVMPRAQIIFTATGATDDGIIQPNSLRFNGLSDQLTIGYSAGGVSESGGIVRLEDGSLALLIHIGNPSRLDDDYIVSNQVVKYSQLFGTQLPWAGNDVFMPEYDSLDTSVSDLIVSISAGPFLWEEDRLERFEETP